MAPAQHSDFSGDSDEAYGGRVFLKHYCIHLAGPDDRSALAEFPADVRAARGFNGDIARHAQGWQTELDEDCDPIRLGRRMARKSLLAVASLVSVHDNTWTTDRTAAAVRWAEIEPDLAADLTTVLGWASASATPDCDSVAVALDGVVSHIVATFETRIGLWASAPEP